MMKMRYLLSTVALLLSPPLAAQTTPPAPTPAAATIPADPALWVVKDQDTTIYLFGTIHALKPQLSWFDSAVRKAFDASGQLVLEIPLPTQEQAKAVIVPLAMDATGKPLTQKLSTEDRKVYAAAMAKLGIPETAFDTFEPWFAGVTLAQIELQKAGFNAAEGVEVALNAAATASGKPVSGLETLEQQLGFFHNLPQADQIAFLISSAKEIDKFDATINAMLDRWKAGDAEGLSALMNEDLSSQPNLYKVLLADRNARWADWIDNRLKTPGTVFIAVGAGHLAGKDSVQAYLAKHHLVAERVRY
ncbi:TraB/GumN family protein [Sphingomonas sp. DC1600-2]|uniref:TraB/GumN family protein n=1 Tax=unclassified Sphingomonas TaxID=196159 RepID=UPI003CEB702F